MRELLEKWEAIHKDWEVNVTRIWERRIIHQMWDVVYYSVLSFPFRGELVKRGWVEALIAGDTRTGKSKVAASLCEFHQVARPIPSENISIAGLIGGVKQHGTKWSISWGMWPRLDKRACTIDEATGLTVDQIGLLSDVRSSGKATITKVESDVTWARVRKLWLSNPRVETNKQVADYLYGVQIIPQIIGRGEDIARFDLATVCSFEEVPEAVLNDKKVRHCKHVYTKELSRDLLYWAWSRRAEDVVWNPGVEDLVLDVASHQCKLYSSDIPLVEPGEQRLRVARVAVALAARFHSTDAGGSRVVVRKAHVELAKWFFAQCYTRSFCDYDGFSSSRKKVQDATAPEEGAETKIAATLSKYEDADMALKLLFSSAEAQGEGLSTRVAAPMGYARWQSFLTDLMRLGLLEYKGETIHVTKKFMAWGRKNLGSYKPTLPQEPGY